MVGIFSRFSASRTGHRRAQSALVETTPTSEAKTATTIAMGVPHGVEVAGEFKPVERPTEPLDSDQPVQCPLAEPSILNILTSGSQLILFRAHSLPRDILSSIHMAGDSIQKSRERILTSGMEEYGRNEYLLVYRGRLIYRLCRNHLQLNPRLPQLNPAPLLTGLFCHLSAPRNTAS